MKFSPQLKQEILNKFKGYKIFLEPEEIDIREELKMAWSIHNDKNLHCFISYDSLGLEEIKLIFDLINKGSQIKPGDFTLEEYSQKFAEKINCLDKTLVLTNLFFDIRSKFLAFHHTFFQYKNLEEDKLFHCSILVSDKDYEIFESTLKYLCSKFDGNPYSEIKNIKLSNNYLFCINIALFYHISNPFLFGYKLGIINKENKLI